jgi:hypothetical protein
MTERKFRAGDRITVKRRAWLKNEVCTVLCVLDNGVVMAKRDNPKGCIRIFPFLHLKPDDVELFKLPVDDTVHQKSSARDI